jgi:hypothetical protein
MAWSRLSLEASLVVKLRIRTAVDLSVEVISVYSVLLSRSGRVETASMIAQIFGSDALSRLAISSANMSMHFVLVIERGMIIIRVFE